MFLPDGKGRGRGPGSFLSTGGGVRLSLAAELPADSQPTTDSKEEHSHGRQQMLDAITTGSLIVQVDDARSLYDPFRLNATLEPLSVTRLTAAKAANSAVLLTAGDQAGARVRVTEARGKLADLLCAGFAYVSGQRALDIPEAEVVDALVSYG